MTSLDLVEAFVHAYRERSVSAAARVLGLSQPAVTARLQRLELERGETLFERTRRGLVPTPAAVALAARTTSLVEGLRSAVDRPAGLVGRLRLGSAADVAALRVVPGLAPLVRDGLELHVTTGLAEDLLSALVAQDLDLVVSSVRPGRDLVATALVDEEFLLVATPAVAAGVDPAVLAEDPVRALAGVPLAAFGPELPIIRRYWLTEFDQRPHQPAAVVLPDLRGLLGVVLAGVGATVLPHYLVETALSEGSLVRLHEPRLGPLNTLWLVTAPDPPDVVAAARDRLREVAAGWAAT